MICRDILVMASSSKHFFLLRDDAGRQGCSAHRLTVHAADPSFEMLVESAYDARVYFGLTGNLVDQRAVEQPSNPVFWRWSARCARHRFRTPAKPSTPGNPWNASRSYPTPGNYDFL